MNAQRLGYEAARLVASVASRETVESWVERACERTVKHLREEVDAAEMLGRVGVDTTMAPPAVTTMDAIADLERRIVMGQALQSGESHMSAGADDRRGHARVGPVHLRYVGPPGAKKPHALALPLKGSRVPLSYNEIVSRERTSRTRVGPPRKTEKPSRGVAVASAARARSRFNVSQACLHRCARPASRNLTPERA